MLFVRSMTDEKLIKTPSHTQWQNELNICHDHELISPKVKLKCSKTVLTFNAINTSREPNCQTSVCFDPRVTCLIEHSL
jgi:hypothetical protein